jgi:hypothetical protein
LEISSPERGTLVAIRADKAEASLSPA